MSESDRSGPLELLNTEYRIDSDAEALFKRRRQVDRALRWFRSCAVCGSLLPPIDLVCVDCWRHFEKIRNRGEWLRQPGYSFPVYSLLTWTDETAHFVRPFIYGLKRGFSVPAYEKLSEILAFERRALVAPLFLHPPSSQAGLDHAEVFAILTGRLWRAPHFRLEPESSAPVTRQKRLNAKERANQRFASVLGPARWECSSRPRVFLDDVITTGSTARAAWSAVGRVQEFEAWTFVCRPKLAASRGV